MTTPEIVDNDGDNLSEPSNATERDDDTEIDYRKSSVDDVDPARANVFDRRDAPAVRSNRTHASKISRECIARRADRWWCNCETTRTMLNRADRAFVVATIVTVAFTSLWSCCGPNGENETFALLFAYFLNAVALFAWLWKIETFCVAVHYAAGHALAFALVLANADLSGFDEMRAIIDDLSAVPPAYDRTFAIAWLIASATYVVVSLYSERMPLFSFFLKRSSLSSSKR